MADNDKKFTFQFHVNSCWAQPLVFPNHYGSWFFTVHRGFDGYYQGKITLTPKKEVALEKIQIHIICYDFNGLQHSSTDAQFHQQQKAFTFTVSPVVFTIASNIKVGAKSCTLMPKPAKDLKSVDYNKQMFESKKLADVIIKTKEGKEIKAHKYILSRSDVFDAMLNKHNTKEAQTKVIEIIDIEYAVLVEAVRFLYCDEVQQMQRMAIDLLVAADKYNIQGLFNQCVLFLSQNIDGKNYSRILITADQLNIEILKNKAIEYIIKNCKQVVPSDEWQQFKSEHVDLAMRILELMAVTLA